MDNPYVGIGLYDFPEAAKLLGVPSYKVRRWAEGYEFKASDGIRHAAPLLTRESAVLREQEIVTFLDLIELYTIRAFREAKVSMHYIRETREWAKKEFSTAHPFASRRWNYDGKRLWTRRGEKIAQEAMRAQLAFQEVVEDFFVNIDYGELHAECFWPLGRRKGIVLDPRRSFGQPIHDGSGVPARTLAGMVQGGTAAKKVAWWYDVPLTAVNAAVEFDTYLRRLA